MVILLYDFVQNHTRDAILFSFARYDLKYLKNAKILSGLLPIIAAYLFHFFLTHVRKTLLYVIIENISCLSSSSNINMKSKNNDLCLLNNVEISLFVFARTN